MSYILDGSPIRNPHSVKESNSTLMAQHRTLDGSVNRDHFGNNKRVWTLDYKNAKVSEYSAIKTIYNSYLADSQAVTFEITETNYTVSSTSVHVDLLDRGFNVRGEDYLSDFTLVLTEA